MATGLEEALAAAEKKYGKSLVAHSGDGTPPAPPNVISSGILRVDRYTLGVGGFSRGRVTEIAGPEGVGKTTLCLHTIAEAQKGNLGVVYVDAELKLDLVYAASLGVDVDKLIHITPVNGEVALGTVDLLCKVKDELALIVFDSVAALGSAKEQEKFLDQNADVAKIPRAINKFLRRNIFAIKENDIAILMTNQLREKVGSRFGGTQTPGGRGLKHYASVLMNLWPAYGGKIEDTAKQQVGYEITISTSKNNVAMPFVDTVAKLWYGKGFWPMSEMLDIGVESGIISKRGSFYYIGELRLGQGEMNALQALEDMKDSELYETTRGAIREWLKEQ